MEIEFLTSLSRQRNNANIQGVIAQPLSYLEMSLKNTIAFQTYSNKSGLVVSPDAWIFHKGLTFTKRTNELKKLKDLYGIWYVATELGDFSIEACNKLNNLRQQQEKWNTTFEKNLRDWMSQATPVLWHQLEAQDPSGRLTKLHFEYLIINILNC